LGEDQVTNVNTNGPIRVLLADDHTMFRQGLASILASYGGMEVIAEVPNDADALELARELSPDVVIMQVQMPFERALKTLKEMSTFSDPPKVVIVTMFESPHYVRALTGVGASAYVLKTSSSEHLVAAVRAAAFDPASENAVVGMPRSMLEGTQEGAENFLSARELEILLLHGPRPLQPADSLLAAPLRGDHQAPPGQRLPEDGGPLQGSGLEGGPLQRVDNHRGGYRRGRRVGSRSVGSSRSSPRRRVRRRHPQP
jgi:DNA-binding NarL/FixJ family response regulator